MNDAALVVGEAQAKGFEHGAVSQPFQLRINASPRMLAQRERLQAAFGTVAQLHIEPEDLLLNIRTYSALKQTEDFAAKHTCNPVTNVNAAIAHRNRNVLDPQPRNTVIASVDALRDSLRGVAALSENPAYPAYYKADAVGPLAVIETEMRAEPVRAKVPDRPAGITSADFERGNRNLRPKDPALWTDAGLAELEEAKGHAGEYPIHGDGAKGVNALRREYVERVVARINQRRTEAAETARVAAIKGQIQRINGAEIADATTEADIDNIPQRQRAVSVGFLKNDGSINHLS